MQHIKQVMQHIKQLPLIKLGTNAVIHSGAQIGIVGNHKIADGKLIQSIAGDILGNIATTAAVTALKTFGISDTVSSITNKLTYNIVDEKILGAVAGATTNALISNIIKLDTSLVIHSALVGASNGWHTANIMEDFQWADDNDTTALHNDADTSLQDV